MPEVPLESSREASMFTGAPSFSLANRLTRATFRLVWALCATWTPPQLNAWRIVLLRAFGARIGAGCKVYGSVSIWLPRNLTMEDHAILGPGVICYNQDRIAIGAFVVVSQRAHLCAGSHDISSPSFQLITQPITVGANSWLCAECFVGPGVTVGEGAVLAARSVAFKELEAWKVYRGNPAEMIKSRPQFSREVDGSA